MVAVPVTDTPAQLRDRGTAQYRAGNYEQAIRLLEQSVNLDGSDVLAYYQLGLAYMAASGREHALEDAELAFRTATSLQPEWAAPYTGLAESFLRRGLYEDAIPPALKATRLEPGSAEAWLTLGRAYRGAGLESEATRAFAEAARLAPAPPAQP
jgi:tetratricopeptide (TPR) repeat protein